MTILELLPQPAKLNEGNELTNVLSNFTSLETQKDTFSLTNLQQVLTRGESLSISNSFTLVSETINNLDKIRAKLPSKPEEITATLQQEFRKMLQDGGNLGGLLTPITQFTKGIAPLLSKLENFSKSVNDINGIVSQLPGGVENLTLTDIPQQIEYFLQVLTVFNVSDVSPFKELKAQIETLQKWLSPDKNALTNQFQSQIQSLATDLPKQLNQVMRVALEVVSQIQDSLKLNDNDFDWLEPYDQALKAVEDINIEELNNSNIVRHLELLDNQLEKVKPNANKLTENTQIALAKMEGFDVSSFSDELRYALQNIFSTISPTSPSALSEISQQIQKLIGGLEVGTLQSVIAQIDQQIDQLIGKVDFSTFPNQVQTITDKISSTADTLDRGLVNLAAFLSNLVKELRKLIGSVKLSEISGKIQAEFGKLTSQVNGLLSKVDQIPEELNQLVDKLKTNVEKIQFNEIRKKIADLLSQITSVLNDPEIEHIRISVQQGIEAIANALSNVSLKPVFERVLSEMADVKSNLATVNVSQLNEVLKKALTLALDKIRKIDFAKDVAEKLKEEFKEIIAKSTTLLESLQKKYQEIVSQIKKFKPGDWVAEKLASPFDKLIAKLEEIEPSKLLKPLENLYNSLLDKLKTFSPKALLSPLITLHSQLMAAVRSLSPHDLITPLNNLLKQVTSLLDKLGIDDLISRISNITQINELLNSLSLSTELKESTLWGTLKKLRIQGNNLLQDAEGQVNQYLDKLIDLVPEVDMNALNGALNDLQNAIKTIKNHITNSDVLIRLKQIPENCQIIEFQNELTNLTKRWLDQKRRFKDFTPPSDAKEAYEKLKASLQLLSPIELLGEAATSVERFTASLNRVQNELTVSQQALSNLLANNLDKLTALLPKEPTLAGFKKLLRDGLEEQIGLPAKELLGLLKQQLVQFDQVFAGLQAIASKFESPAQILTVIPQSIDSICRTLLESKNKITNLNFNFLEDELQGVIETIITELDSLNPESLLTELDKTYNNLLDTLKRLYPEVDIKKLDSIYKEAILDKLKELHPNRTIAEPLDKEYDKILELQEQLNVDKIFDVLTKKLDTLEKELDDGLKKTAIAFNQLLQALPL